MSDSNHLALLLAFHENSPEYNHAAWVVLTSLTFLILSIVLAGAKKSSRFRITGLKLYDALKVLPPARAVMNQPMDSKSWLSESGTGAEMIAGGK